MQLTTENTEKYTDNKRKKTAFFVFLCELSGFLNALFGFK